jgi:macrolide transport system ATP-binding/permease protein
MSIGFPKEVYAMNRLLNAFSPWASQGVREEHGLSGLDSCLQDVRYAVRSMRARPGFTLITVITLAMGIGLCSVLFTVLNAFVLRPVPGVSGAGELVALEAPVPFSYFENYRGQKSLAADVAAFIGPVPIEVAVNAAAATKPERIFGHLVSTEYFSTLGVRPLMGRFFDAAREVPGAAPTVVLSEHFWRTRLDADPHVIGRAVRVNGRQGTIIGISSKDFLGVFPITLADIFLPVTADPLVAPELTDDVLYRTTQPSFRVLLRLARGKTRAATESRVEGITRELDQQTTRRDLDPKTRRVHLLLAGQLMPLAVSERSLIVTFYGLLVALILTLTSSNLAGLILARGNARWREIAIRLSIGATRVRVIRLLLTESLILAALGGVTGFAAAYGVLCLLSRVRTDAVLPQVSIVYSPDLRVVLFTFLISGFAGAAFGLLPAFAITPADLAGALKANLGIRLRRYRRFGLRNFFVVYQIAAAIMLITIMGFWSNGLRNAVNLDPGFDPAPVQFFSVDPVRDGLSPDRSASLLTDLAQRLQGLPGVTSVTLADRPPLSQAVPDSLISVPSQGAGTGVSVHSVAVQKIGPAYFATLGVSLLRGSEFSERDLRSHPAPTDVLPAIVNQTAAKDLFGSADPIGRRIRQDIGGVRRVFQVTGVVRYDRPSPMASQPVPAVFLPLTQKDLQRGPQSGMIVLLRGHTHLSDSAISLELASIDQNLAPFNSQSMAEFLASLNRVAQRGMGFVSGIGVFGLLLACIGLAGVTAQAAERRRKEIGIRIALGATPRQVLRLVMREGASMTLIGAALGFLGARAILRALAAASSQMAEIIDRSAGDRALTLGIPLLLVSLAMIACYLPARRSTALDPVIALREE